MEKLQRRACKIILGKDYVTLEDALKNLNLLTFEEMLFITKAKLMHKIANSTTPTKQKLIIFKRSLSYSGALEWNSIPIEITNADTLSSFVLKCSNWLKHGMLLNSSYCCAITSTAKCKSNTLCLQMHIAYII